MTDIELKEIINSLRDFTFKERKKNLTRTVDLFFVNTIEIACNLTELGIVQKRAIKKEEKNIGLKDLII